MEVHMFLFLFLLSLFSLIAADSSSDLSSLLAFKSISDRTGVLATNWTTDTWFCNWVGVTCNNQESRVVSLNLTSFNLRGTIAPHLANLSFLTSLDLYNNSLIGPIPPAIFNMSSLVHIDLSTNNISGTIPQLINLPRLEFLALGDDSTTGDNSITGNIPDSLSQCLNLKKIDLAGNMLTGSVPSWLGNLSLLTWINLEGNQLTGRIPTSIGNLTKLTDLSLNMNNMVGEIPEEFGNLVNLQYLNLVLNELSGAIPISLMNASQIKWLYIGGNYLTGTVPAMLGKSMPLLQEIQLSQNNLTGGLDFIASLTNCRNLTKLDAAENQLEGVLPDVWNNLSVNIQYFYVYSNKIRGNIPAGIGNLTNLIALALFDNEMTGTIPPTISNMNMLQAMAIGNNRLAGQIPSEIGLMKHLYLIDLSGNKLSGKIPESVGNMSSLQIFTAPMNNLSSSIPLSLWGLKGLTNLNLYQNNIEGLLPPEITKSLNHIDLSSNRLSGNISDALGELQMITYLDLSNNSLHGEIPQQLGKLFLITYLNLSNNFLSGAIPKSFSNLSYLEHLDLSFNMLEGEIPQGKVFSNVSITSLEGNRALCGDIILHFRPCPAIVLVSKSKGKHRLLRYLLPSLSSLLVIIACVSLFLIVSKRKKVKASSQEETPWLNYHRWISYIELSRATDKFSEANLLGTGAFGKVYKGTLDDGLIVAVKVLNLETEGALKSFDAECRTLGMARHRNLVKIISTCSNTEFKALVLEFMPNQSLDMWLYSQSHHLTLLQRINIMVDVSTALDYLHHRHGHVIVHCDLKPSNILLDGKMGARVSDFGIAKLMLLDTKSLVSTNSIGTIGYIPPEYGSTGGITKRGDVYSFGILLLELITGKKPTDTMFSGELSLRQWVSNTYNADLLEIVDSDIVEHDFSNQQNPEQASILRKCILSTLDLGLCCSRESPNERLEMNEVATSLEEIRNKMFVQLGSMIH